MKVGDYVRIREGVNDTGMPKSQRDGLIVEVVGESKDQAMVLFSNNTILKFHKSWITYIGKIDEI